MMCVINWVETPKCSECNLSEPIKGRYCCLGCYKKKKDNKKRQRSHLLNEECQDKRNEIIALRREGKSYALIGLKLNLSRSTVQSIIRSLNKRGLKISA